MVERDYVQQLALKYYKGEIRRAFLDSIAKISDEMVLKDIATYIESGQLEKAVDAAKVTVEKFDEMKNVTANAVQAGAKDTSKILPAVFQRDQKVKIKLQPGSRRAMNAVDELHTGLIRDVTDEARDTVREHIREGLRMGKNPRVIAESIRGEWDSVTKKYKKGVIGLTRQQQEWVINTERQLRSGDPKQLREYLGKKLRMKKYDRAILRAINEGKEVPEQIIQSAVADYRGRAVEYRAETVARDQALEAVSKGQELATDEFVDKGSVRNSDILQFWITARDSRVRDQHSRVPGMNRGGVRRGEMFSTPFGLLKRPRDRSSPGSVPANIIQCRCSLSIRVRRQA